MAPRNDALPPSDRLRYQPVTADDLPAFHGLIQDDHARRYMLDGALMPEDWTAARIGDSAALFARRGVGVWLARDRDSGALVGFVGFLELAPPESEPQLMYAMFGRFAGRGYATEMAGAVIARAHEQGFPHVVAEVDEVNGASLRVLEKLGFRRVATLPGAFGNMFRLRLAWEAPRAVLVGQLRALGVEPGGVLIAHTAFSKVGPVEGGPGGLIDALREALGPDGTLVMPSMCDDDDQPFDPKTSACRSLGVVADTFWRLPGVRRSDSPHAFAAIGPRAAQITAPHPVDVPHGPDSPPGRVHALDGQVLLLGVGHDADTTIHLAELLAGVRYRRRAHATIFRDGRPTRVEYGENDSCCARFALADEWLDAGGRQRRATVGHAEARLARSRDIVGAVVARLSAEETLFLHPPGVDAECDEARASLPAGSQ
jgi:aminoglycoside N3'-acetyltransferase/RimJ/RimL family protein N-acetyltransferase